MSLQALQTLGLTTTESNLYELLLKLGETPVADIILRSGLKRPTVYKALYSLEKKGLVKQQDIKKKLHFRPESPTILLEQAESQYKEAEQTRNVLQAVIPELLSSYTFSVERPVVKVYEGFEGLKEIYLDTIEEEKPLFSFLQTAEVDESMYQWLTNEYVKKRAHKKIHAKVVVALGKFSKDYISKDVQEFRTTKVVDSSIYPIQHEVIIYGDKIAFLNYKKGEKLIGILVQHPQISQTMKAIFNLAWDGIK